MTESLEHRGRWLATFILPLFLFGLPSRPSCEVYSPQPVVLVHGKQSDETDWEEIAAYLGSQTSTSVRIYRYSFSDPEDTITNWGRELGDRTYSNPGDTSGRCWLKRVEGDLGGPPAHGYRLVGWSAGSLDLSTTSAARRGSRCSRCPTRR